MSLMFFMFFMSYFLCDTMAQDEQVKGVDTYDVWIQLFEDSQCLFQTEDIILTTDNCYANRYDLPPNNLVSLGYAFRVSIVNLFNRTMGDRVYPRMINFAYFRDKCLSTNAPSLQMVENQCSGAIERPMFGKLYGYFTLKHRSTTCNPELNLACSVVRLSHLEYFKSDSCSSLPYLKLSYPINRECLRYDNGTQLFYLDPNSASTIIEVDFPHSPDCTVNEIGCANCVVPAKFYMQRDQCYKLKDFDSFRWTVDPEHGEAAVGEAEAAMTKDTSEDEAAQIAEEPDGSTGYISRPRRLWALLLAFRLLDSMI